MHKNPIVGTMVSLLTVAASFCPIAYADQGGALIEAARKGDLKQVQELLDEGVNINSSDKEGQTALMNAARKGMSEVVTMLLEEGIEVNAKDNMGRTALNWAAGLGHMEVARTLLQKGADINNKGGWNGATPLMWAAENGHLGAVKLLLEKGADVKAVADKGDTILICALRNRYPGGNQITSTRLLLENGVMQCADQRWMDGLYVCVNLQLRSAKTDS